MIISFLIKSQAHKKNTVCLQKCKINSVLKSLACLEGFEPPTFWFVAKHSITMTIETDNYIYIHIKYIVLELTSDFAIFD